MRIPIRVDFLGSQSVVPSQERMIKCHVVPSFLNPDPLATDLFSVSVSYCLLAFLLLCPEYLAWQPSGWEYPNMVR